MRLVGDSQSHRSGAGLFQAASRVVRGFTCRSWVAVMLTISECAGGSVRARRGSRTGAVPRAGGCGANLGRCWPTQDHSMEVKVRALLAERRQRIGYERQLSAANAACH